MKKIVLGLILASLLMLSPLLNVAAQDASSQENVVLWWAREANSSGEFTLNHTTMTYGASVNVTHHKVWDISAYWGIGINASIATSVEDSTAEMDLEGFHLVNVTINGYMHDVITIDVESVERSVSIYIDVLRQIDISYINSFEAPLTYETWLPVNIMLGAINATVNITHTFKNGTVRTESMSVSATIWMNATLYLNVSSYVVGGIYDEENNLIDQVTWNDWGIKTIDLSGYEGQFSVVLDYYVENLHAKFYDINTTVQIDTGKIEEKSECMGLGMVLKFVLKKVAEHKLRWTVGEQKHGKKKGHEGFLTLDEESESIDIIVSEFADTIYQTVISIGVAPPEEEAPRIPTWLIIVVAIGIIAVALIILKKR